MHIFVAQSHDSKRKPGIYLLDFPLHPLLASLLALAVRWPPIKRLQWVPRARANYHFMSLAHKRQTRTPIPFPFLWPRSFNSITWHPKVQLTIPFRKKEKKKKEKGRVKSETRPIYRFRRLMRPTVLIAIRLCCTRTPALLHSMRIRFSLGLPAPVSESATSDLEVRRRRQQSLRNSPSQLSLLAFNLEPLTDTLQELNLRGNGFRGLPRQLQTRKFPRLRKLDLSHNPLRGEK